MPRLAVRALLVALGSSAPLAPAVAGDCADLALVLAVDASSSVDHAEYALQTEGFAAAFRDPAVVAALAMAGRVDVAAVFWGDPAAPFAVTDWWVVRSGRGAEAVAEGLERAPRTVMGATALGLGLGAALDLLDDRCAARKVVNVSGDGRESLEPRKPARLSAARSAAAARGVVVNGLAIRTEDPGLDACFRDYVMAGPGAFVMAVDDFDDFGAAIARKLAREITPPLYSALDAPAAVLR